MNNKQKTSNPTQTVLIITLGFIVVFILGKAAWALYLAIGIGAAGSLSKYLAIKIDYLWGKLIRVLSMIMPNIILSAFFFVFLTPLAFLSRLFGEKDPLYLKNPGATVFKSRNKKFDSSSMEKPW